MLISRRTLLKGIGAATVGGLLPFYTPTSVQDDLESIPDLVVSPERPLLDMLVGGERLSVLSALTWEEINGISISPNDNGEYFGSAESITRHAQALLSYDQASAVYNTLVLGKRVDADLHPCYSTWTLRLTGLYVTDITADSTGVVANMVYEKGEWI